MLTCNANRQVRKKTNKNNKLKQSSLVFHYSTWALSIVTITFFCDLDSCENKIITIKIRKLVEKR